jgi:hypothetical protein
MTTNEKGCDICKGKKIARLTVTMCDLQLYTDSDACWVEVAYISTHCFKYTLHKKHTFTFTFNNSTSGFYTGTFFQQHVLQMPSSKEIYKHKHVSKAGKWTDLA